MMYLFEFPKELLDKLDRYPKVKARIELEAGTVGCKDYIASLLSDTRGGTRQGFPLDILEVFLALEVINTEYLENIGLEFPDFEESKFSDTTWKLPKNF